MAKGAEKWWRERPFERGADGVGMEGDSLQHGPRSRCVQLGGQWCWLLRPQALEKALIFGLVWVRGRGMTGSVAFETSR